MADHTHIEWCDSTWQPITGCSVVSPGCTNCYAMRLAGTRLRHHPSRAGLTRDSNAGPVWTGEVRLNEQWLDQPLRWKRPRRIFVCAHGDLFAEGVPDEWIDQVFAVMALAPQHTFQVLTKRADRMRKYVEGAFERREALGDLMGTVGGSEREGWYAPECDGRRGWVGMHLPLPNVWLGVSAEDQKRANERIPHLLATPAAVRFVSAEPLLGPIDFMDIPWPSDRPRFPEIDDISDGRSSLHPIAGSKLDWIIVGGESGPVARPMHPAWVCSIRDQCAAAGTAFFFKQWGAWLPWHHFMSAYIADDPEQTRFSTMEWDDGRWRDVGRPQWCDEADGNIDGTQCVALVGKSRAGRLLDGIEHSAFPHI
ncbi:MAG: phage Gp37/Gp68 family protein [Rhizobiaceae bacterium]|nr:phage Gp37/Gp68 family protein [Rhizobiaceae bacterium]